MTDDWFDYISWAILALVGVFVVGLLGWLIFTLINEVGVSVRRGLAKVVGVSFEPAHTTTTMMLVGKVMIPQSTYHPDSWYISVEHEGDVFGADFDSGCARAGERREITYAYGRLTGKKILKSIR